MTDFHSGHDFCAELSKRTKEIHDQSDKAVRIKLAVALTDIKIYAEVLGDFYYVFKAIEELVTEHKECRYLSELWLSQLSRKKCFELDLSYYLGLGWKNVVKPSDAALKYVSHLQETCGSNPEILIAYVHTMYLALLAGGYILRKIIKRTLGLSGDDGLKVFEFSEDSRNQLRTHIKKAINKMDLNEDIKEKIVQEKIKIFAMNNLIIANVRPKLSSYYRVTTFLLIVLFIVIMLMYALWHIVF